MADQTSTAFNFPNYYQEVVKFRKHGYQVDPENKICLKFVPTKDELSAVYNTPLTNLLSKKQLPFAVKVKENFSVGKKQGGINLKDGSMLMMHFIVRPERVFAENPKHEDVVLPIHAQQLYEVLPMDSVHDGKVFYGTAEVINSNPLPKRLRIVDAIYSDAPGEAQEEGEIIEVSHVEKRGSEKVLVGRSSLTKQSFSFSEQMKESTYSAMITEEHISLSTIVRKFKLPLRVRKVGEKKSVFILNEVRKDAQVICTDPHNNEVFTLALTCPLRLDYIDNQGVEAIVKATIPQLYPILNWTWDLSEIGRTPLPLQQRQTPQPLLGVLCHWLNSKDGLELVSMITDSSSETKNAEILSLKKRIRELGKQLSQQPRPPIPPRAPSIKNRDAMTYEHVLPTPAPRQPPQMNVELEKRQQEIAKLKKEKQDLIVSLNKQQVENKTQQSKISQLLEEISRLKKGNYLIQVDVHSASNPPYEVPSQRKFSDESVTNILKFLDGIGLSGYSETFGKEQVDGALLCDLVTDGEEIFINELKMKRLHARKLIVEIKRRL